MEDMQERMEDTLFEELREGPMETEPHSTQNGGSDRQYQGPQRKTGSRQRHM
jgi:hypothetical protein